MCRIKVNEIRRRGLLTWLTHWYHRSLQWSRPERRCFVGKRCEHRKSSVSSKISVVAFCGFISCSGEPFFHSIRIQELTLTEVTWQDIQTHRRSHRRDMFKNCTGFCEMTKLTVFVASLQRSVTVVITVCDCFRTK